MTQAKQDNQISIRFEPNRAEDVESLSQSDLILVSRGVTVLFSAWALLKFSDDLDFTDLDTLLVIGGLLFVVYWGGCFAIRHGLRYASKAITNYLSSPAVDALNASTEYWSISDNAIRRHHTNHVQVFSLNSVNIADQKQPEQVDVTFCNGATVSFSQANCESERSWNEALEILKHGPNANRNMQAELEPVMEADKVESCYNKQEARLLNQRNGGRECQRKYRMLRCGLFVMFVCCMMIYGWFSDNFSPVKAIGFGCLIAANSFSGTLGIWSIEKMARHQTHFWRVSRQDFRFGTRHQHAYQETVRNWDDLVAAEETEQGVVVSFQSPPQVTLIPKNSAPLRQWEQVVSKLRKFAGSKMRHKLQIPAV